MQRLKAGFCNITKSLRIESQTHRIYITAPNPAFGEARKHHMVSVYRKDSSTTGAIMREFYNTRAGAMGFVKGFFRIPIGS